MRNLITFVFSIVLTANLNSQVTSLGIIPNSKKQATAFKKDSRVGLEIIFVKGNEIIFEHSRSSSLSTIRKKPVFYYGNIKSGLEEEIEVRFKHENKEYEPVFFKQIEDELYGFFVSTSENKTEIIKVQLVDIKSNSWKFVESSLSLNYESRIFPATFLPGIEVFSNYDHIFMSIPNITANQMEIVVFDSKMKLINNRNIAFSDQKLEISGIRKISNNLFSFHLKARQTGEFTAIYDIKTGLKKLSKPMTEVFISKGFNNEYIVSYYDKEALKIYFEEYDTTFNKIVDKVIYDVPKKIANVGADGYDLTNPHYRKKGKTEEFIFSLILTTMDDRTLGPQLKLINKKVVPNDKPYHYRNNRYESWEHPKDGMLKQFVYSRTNGFPKFDALNNLVPEFLQTRYVPFMRNNKIELLDTKAKVKTKQFIKTNISSKRMVGPFYINDEVYIISSPDLKSLEVLEIKE